MSINDSDKGDLGGNFNPASGSKTRLGNLLDQRLAAMSSEERTKLEPLVTALKENEGLAEEERLQDLARLKADYSGVGRTARILINIVTDDFPISVRRQEAEDPQLGLFAPWQRQQYMEDEVLAVRGLPDDKKVAAYARLLARYSDLQTRYKGDKEKQAPFIHLKKMINRLKYDELPLGIFLDEILNSKSELFTSKERKNLEPVALAIKANNELPEDDRLEDLARLKTDYDGNTRAQELIKWAANTLPTRVIAGEVANPKTTLFPPQERAALRNQFKI